MKTLRLYILCMFLCLLMYPLPSGYADDTLSDRDRATLGLAETFSNRGEYEKALSYLESLHARYPQNEKIVFIYAQALGYARDPAGAVNTLTNFSFQDYSSRDINDLCLSIYESSELFAEGSLFAEKTFAEVHDQRYLVSAVRLALWAHAYDRAFRIAETCQLDPIADKALLVMLADAYRSVGRTDEARATLDALLVNEPNDIDILLRYASILHEGGNADGTVDILSRILAAHPTDINVKQRLAETYASLQEFGKALELIEDMRADAAVWTPELKVTYARILSWQGRHEEAISVYNELLENDAENRIALREKARVLGWERLFNASNDTYDRLASFYPEHDGYVHERSLKRALYGHRFRTAAAAGMRWLAHEPDDPEALFDMAYISTQMDDWPSARHYYNEIRSRYPANEKARRDQELVDFYETRKTVRLGCSFIEKDSADRDADIRSLSFNQEGVLPIAYRCDLLAEHITALHDTSVLSLTSESLSLGLRYAYQYWLRVSSIFGMTLYTDTNHETACWENEVSIIPHDMIRFTIHNERSDLLENGETIKRRIQKDSIALRLEYEPVRRIIVGADYAFAHYSNKATENRYGGDIRLRLFFEPADISLRYRFEEYGFRKERPYHFTPSSFHSHSLAFDWKQHIPWTELYWGMKETYIHARYSIHWDVHSQRGHTLYAGFKKDWHRRVSTELFWEKKLYEHSDTYAQDSLNGQCTLYF